MEFKTNKDKNKKPLLEQTSWQKDFVGGPKISISVYVFAITNNYNNKKRCTHVA